MLTAMVRAETARLRAHGAVHVDPDPSLRRAATHTELEQDNPLFLRARRAIDRAGVLCATAGDNLWYAHRLCEYSASLIAERALTACR
jgi:hypothetical protein